MKKIILALFLITSCSYNLTSKNLGKKAQAIIINNKGKEIGTANFTQGSQGVLINIKAKKLPAGKHGMHFHNVGNCADYKRFKMAKGHIMPKNKPHGFLNKKGPHAGNLPNLIVAKNGKVEVEIYSQLISLFGDNGKPALLDKDGSSLVIHENIDDHNSQPIGGSGARIACGLIKNHE